MKSHASHREMAASLVVSLLMLAGVLRPAMAQTPIASPAPDVTSSWQTTTCMYDLPKGFTEGKNAECGFVTAPLRYDGSTDKTIKLAVVKLKSTASKPAAEPLMILNGGPGQALGAVLPTFGAPLHMYDYLLERQDVILFDQRGMGMSEPSLACPFEETTAATPAATPIGTPSPEDSGALTGTDEAAYQKMWNECGKVLEGKGIDLTAFNTQNNAADINAIRHAMGYEKVDLYGISYGSRLALETERAFPQILHSVIIASPFPPEANGMADQVIGFDRSLKLVFANCAKDPECARINPDLEQTFHSVVKKLHDQPIMLNVQDPTTGNVIPLPMNDQLFMQFIYIGVFAGSLTPFVPIMITSANVGEKFLFETLGSILMDPSSGVRIGALTSFFCQEEVPFDTQSETEAEIAKANVMPEVTGKTFVGIGENVYPACDAWKLPSAPQTETEPVKSDVPTLILTGRYDPITPIKNGEMVHKNLSNSQLVTFENAGHDPGSQFGPCASGMISGFLADPMKKVDAACAATPVDFSPDFKAMGIPVPSASPEASPVATPKP